MANRKLFGFIPMWLAVGVALIGLVVTVVLVVAVVSNIDAILTFIFEPSQRTTEVVQCSESAGCRFWHPVIYTAILLAVVVTGFAYTTLLERKFIAYFQQRVGPNRVGPGGFLQPAADGVKLIFKEDIMPSGATRSVYLMAPLLKAMPTLVVLAVIPIGPPIIVPWFDGNWYRVPLQLFDPNVGILWLLAVTSIGTYGVALAGWASNNKYAMLGGLRASAQMVSYELTMGISLAVPILIVGSMSLYDIVEHQGGFAINWLVFQNPLAAIILIIALIAETNRAPFDLPEAEQELTAGYMTEYSGMKFALFMMAEYLGMIAVSLIAISTFFGGYQDGFGLVDGLPILGPLVTVGKVILLLIGFIWLRATLPRIRYDRLMTLGWKVLLPLSLISVVWTAVAVVAGDAFGTLGYVVASGLLFAIIVGTAYLMFGRSATTDEAEDDLETDPIITGESYGIGHIILQVIGGLVAVPFVLFDVTIKAMRGGVNVLVGVLEYVAKLGGAPVGDTKEEETPLPTKSGGD